MQNLNKDGAGAGCAFTQSTKIDRCFLAAINYKLAINNLGGGGGNAKLLNAAFNYCFQMTLFS